MAKKAFLILFLLFSLPAFAGSGHVVFSIGGYLYSPLAVNDSDCDTVAAAFKSWAGYSGSTHSCNTNPVRAGTVIVVSGFGPVTVNSITATSVSEDFQQLGNRIATLETDLSNLNNSVTAANSEISRLSASVTTLQNQIQAGGGDGIPFDPATAGQFFAFMFVSTLVLWLIAHQAGLIAQAVKNS